MRRCLSSLSVVLSFLLVTPGALAQSGTGRISGLIFNLFDTVNFSDPNPLASSTNFGTITDTRVPPRIIQLGIKWYF